MGNGASGSTGSTGNTGSTPATGTGTYKLTYFNARGRGEPIRLAFAAAGVKYEDFRVEQKDWPSYKAKTPMGFMPVVAINGKEVCETPMVIGCVGREVGLHGKTNTEAGQVDMWLATLASLQTAMFTAITSKEDKAAATEKFLKEQMPGVLAALEKLAASSWAVGSSMTVADLMLFDVNEKLGMAGTNMDKYKKLAAIVKKVQANPKVAEWVEKRPKSDF